MTPAIRRAYVDNIYGQLHYRRAAPEGAPTKPTLLCCHQTPRSGWEWEPIIGPLATDRVVLAPDTPGYGASDPPPAPATIEDFAKAMIRFIDDMQAKGLAPPGPVDVIGYHTGSVTATELAKTYPDRIRRIIPIGLAAYDAETRADKLKNIDIFPTPKENNLSHVERLWGIMEGIADKRAEPEWRHAALAESLRTGKRLHWGFQAVYKYDFLGAMPQVKQPVMVINLEDDLRGRTDATAHLYPNGKKVDIDGAAHGILLLETDRIVKLIRDFLDN